MAVVLPADGKPQLRMPEYVEKPLDDPNDDGEKPLAVYPVRRKRPLTMNLSSSRDDKFGTALCLLLLQSHQQ